MSFNFGVPKTSAPTFSVPTSSTAVVGGSGDAKTETPQKPSLFGTGSTSLFGQLPPAATSASSLPPSISFGTPNVAATSSVASAIGGTQGLGTSSISFQTPKTTTGDTPKLGFTIPATTSASLLGSSMTPTSKPAIVATTTPALGSTLSLPTTTPVTTQSILPASSDNLSFAQLEDAINKWTVDMEDQSKQFLLKAKELNAWDYLLVSNGEKIIKLNEILSKAKEQQKRLDQELDLVMSQQNELDQLSIPLEKQLMELPITDESRFQVYGKAEEVDNVLKQMTESLKDIIEHMNEANRKEDLADPITQVSQILNAHMNSLQWIDKNTTQIAAQLDEIHKIQEETKKTCLHLY